MFLPGRRRSSLQKVPGGPEFLAYPKMDVTLDVRVKQILFIFGTRPEAIKLCPIIRHMRSSCHGIQVKVCVTAQHRAMLDQVLECFEVAPDFDLNLMTPGQTLAQITARVLSALDTLLA